MGRTAVGLLLAVVCGCSDADPAERADARPATVDAATGDLLFEDGFDSFPGDDWITGSFNREPAGVPPPSIACSAAGGDDDCGATLVSTGDFDPSDGLTLCAWLAIEGTGAGSSVGVTAPIRSGDAGASGSLAASVWGDGHVSFVVADPEPLAGEPITDGAFHEFCLVVAPGGAAEWRVDGATQASGTAPDAPIGLVLEAHVGDTFVGRIDALRITRP